MLYIIFRNIVVWGSVFSSLMEDIERIHMRAIRVDCKLPMTTSADEIKKLRQWNPISLYYVKRLLVLRPINLIII